MNPLQSASQPYSILVADDDERICRVIEQVLSSDGMRVTAVQKSQEALNLARAHSYDLIMLDVMFAGDEMDGFSVIKSLRQAEVNTPIFLISAHAEESNKVYGLGIGAVEYITKPFSVMELLYRVKAILRQCNQSAQTPQRIDSPPFLYLPNEMRLYKTGKDGKRREIALTNKESQMMYFFLTHPHWILTPDKIYEAVWCNQIVDNNTIMVHISKLRSKIEDNPSSPVYIKTVRGIGYKFVLPMDE